MLICIDDVITPEELKRLQTLMAQANWANGSITAGAQAAQVKNNLQIPEEAPQLAEMRHIVLGALSRNAMFFTAALPLKILHPFFNCYGGATNTYGWHTDCAMRQHAGQYIRSDVSATLFLSNPEDYDGGELTIDDTFGRHSIKLKAGSLVVYPSSSIHQVTPVTRGERRACFMFMQSMVRDAGQRRLLFDMDMALLKLRGDVGETEPVVTLTGTYHNLLRQWAEN